MTGAQETLSASWRDRARCIRTELLQLLRQAEEGRVCLFANANDILELAKELVEVENKLTISGKWRRRA